MSDKKIKKYHKTKLESYLTGAIFCTVFLSGFLLWENVEAACTGASPTWTTTPDYESVSACVAGATAGDTINISAGSVAWGSTLNITKSVNLIGAGSDQTIITASSSTLTTISINLSAEVAFRLSGIKFTGLGYSPWMLIKGLSKLWRIDHNVFEASEPKKQIYVQDNLCNNTGLFDSNTFKNVGIEFVGTSRSASNTYWTCESQWGKDSAVFIENNSFTYDVTSPMKNCIDSNNGARAVIRYNTFQDVYIMAHSACDGETYQNRGTRSYEVYNNLFTRTSNDAWGYWFSLRSGSALVFNNSITNWTNPNDDVGMDNRRSWGDSYCTGSTWGSCDGTSLVDGNFGSSGYACLDQIGRGKAATSDPTDNSGYSPSPWQALEPVYAWNNGSSSLISSYNNSGNQPQHIVENRDFYNASSMSDAKTKGLVANYAPYDCPHPLVGAGSCDSDVAGTEGYNATSEDTIAPAAPSGLAVS